MQTFQQTFAHKIASISLKKKALFGLYCTRKVLPYYQHFEDEISSENDPYIFGFKGGTKKLKALSENALLLITNHTLQEQNYRSYIQKCLNLAPDTERISSYNTVLAQNGAISLSYVYQFLIDKDIRNILYCSAKVMESLDIIGTLKNLNLEDMKLAIQVEEKEQIRYLDKLREDLDITEKLKL